MTHCIGLPAERSLEAYVQGTLAEDEAKRFEEHYFECSACLSQVEAFQAVERKFNAAPRKLLKKPTVLPVRSGGRWLATWGAIAAMLLLGFFAVRERRQGHESQAFVSTKDGSVTQLADLELPVLEMPNLRGPRGNALYAAGLKAYAGSDCPGAIRSFSQIPSSDADSIAGHFYTGVCEMHSGDLTKASASLNGVVGSGDSPQLEPAYYYLAQIALARNDSNAALGALSSAIALHGEYEGKARAESERILTAAEKR